MQWIYSNVLKKNLECLGEKEIEEVLCVMTEREVETEEGERLCMAVYAGVGTMLNKYPKVRETHKVYLMDLVRNGIDMLEVDSPKSSYEILYLIKVMVSHHPRSLSLPQT